MSCLYFNCLLPPAISKLESKKLKAPWSGPSKTLDHKSKIRKRPPSRERLIGSLQSEVLIARWRALRLNSPLDERSGRRRIRCKETSTVQGVARQWAGFL